MHWRRLATFLLGSWMAGLFLTAYAMSERIRIAQTLLEAPHPRAAEMMQALGEDRTRMLLRHYMSEQNRAALPRFEWFEMSIGIALTALLAVATHVNRLAPVLSGLMTAMTGFLHLWLTPQIAYLGGRLDFVGENALADERNRLWALQAAYSGVVAVKVIMGAALTWYLLTYKNRFRAARSHGKSGARGVGHGLGG